jgi:hypothetical protein
MSLSAPRLQDSKGRGLYRSFGSPAAQPAAVHMTAVELALKAAHVTRVRRVLATTQRGLMLIAS